jgi:hypothetical protein
MISMNASILCLSSGVRPRYLEDVLRASAMPDGSRLRFRYFEELVPIELREKLKTKDLVGADVLIAYLARYDPRAAPLAIPVRAAVLRDSKIIGRIVVLDLELSTIKVADDLQGFNDALRREANIPSWQGDSLVGTFCTEIQKALSYVKSKAEISDWQDLAGGLRAHRDFDGVPFFYFVTGLFAVGDDKPLRPNDGVWSLSASRTYELRLMSYIPNSDENGSIMLGDVDWLIAEAEGDMISFASTNRLAVDSPYDEKVLRFRTTPCSTIQHSLLSLQRVGRERKSRDDVPTRKESDHAAQVSWDAIWQFEIPLTISPRKWTLIWQGLLVGTLIAAQGLVPIWSKPHSENSVFLSVIAIVIGLLTGLVASFGLRKP